MVRFGSARRPVEVAATGGDIHIHHGQELVARHTVVAPGECSIVDDHRASDVRSILEAGAGVPTLVDEGEALLLDLPAVPTRSLEDYRLEPVFRTWERLG